LKVRVGSTSQNYHSLWWDSKKQTLNLIDQRKLPFVFEIYQAKKVQEVCSAIKEMVVRGAPLIGVTAAYGLVLAAKKYRGSSFTGLQKEVSHAKALLEQTRPTAVDLFNCLEIMTATLLPDQSVEENIQLLEKQAQNLLELTLEECKKIGIIGQEIFTTEINNVLTYCNAGALATIDYGTALAPIREAHNRGKEIKVFVPETRPRLQGGRLTAWELAQEGIPHQIITDNAIGYFMRKGEIDVVLVGADRIALNGDIANKIGTFMVSVLAKELGVPFYVAAPFSTFDNQRETGKEIPIEERAGAEVRTVLCVENAQDQKPQRRIIHNLTSPNRNPAFDITPAENISGIITAGGILKPPLSEAIKKLQA